jgi:hypothetical protein
MTNTETTPTTGGSTEPASTENGTSEAAAAKRSTVDDLPVGPTKTRTGAEATVIEGPQGKRIFTAGGDKGGKIAELLRSRPDLPRKEIATMVGCSQSRVAEVARVLGLAAARPKPTPTPESANAPADSPEPAAEAPSSVAT